MLGQDTEMYVQKLSYALETKDPGAHRVSRSNRGVGAAAVMLLLVALLAMSGCAGGASGAAPTLGSAIADHFAFKYGQTAASSIRVVATKPWYQGLAVMYDATASADRGEWQYYAYLEPEGSGWVMKEWLGGGSQNQDETCNRAMFVQGQQFEVVAGRVCGSRAARVRIVWRGGESPVAVVEDLMRDGRFFTVHSSSSIGHCYEALDEAGQVLFQLNADPSAQEPVLDGCLGPA